MSLLNLLGSSYPLLYTLWQSFFSSIKSLPWKHLPHMTCSLCIKSMSTWPGNLYISPTSLQQKHTSNCLNAFLDQPPNEALLSVSIFITLDPSSGTGVSSSNSTSSININQSLALTHSLLQSSPNRSSHNFLVHQAHPGTRWEASTKRFLNPSIPGFCSKKSSGSLPPRSPPADISTFLQKAAPTSVSSPRHSSGTLI